MADPRAAARSWLGERHDLARDLCAERAHTMTNFPCAACLADAILNASGVEVDEVIVAGGCIDAEGNAPTRVVIRLPAQPIGEGGDVMDG